MIIGKKPKLDKTTMMNNHGRNQEFEKRKTTVNNNFVDCM